MYTMRYHIYFPVPSWAPPRSLLTYPLPTSCLFILFYNLLSQFNAAHIYMGMELSTGTWVIYKWLHPQREWFPWPSVYKLPVTLQYGVECELPALLWKRRQKEFRNWRIQPVLWNVVFSTGHHCCTHETTGRIVTVTGPEKDQHRKQQPHCSMCVCIHPTQNLCQVSYYKN